MDFNRNRFFPCINILVENHNHYTAWQCRTVISHIWKWLIQHSKSGRHIGKIKMQSFIVTIWQQWRYRTLVRLRMSTWLLVVGMYICQLQTRPKMWQICCPDGPAPKIQPPNSASFCQIIYGFKHTQIYLDLIFLYNFRFSCGKSPAQSCFQALG